jgi:hypothetical protein
VPREIDARLRQRKEPVPSKERLPGRVRREYGSADPLNSSPTSLRLEAFEECAPHAAAARPFFDADVEVHRG